MGKDYYAVLGIEKSADAATIKKAYRKLAQRYHPDKNPDDKAAEERFKEITEAYAVLSDAEKKRQYDQFGDSGFHQRFSQEDIFRNFNGQDIFREFGFGGDIFSQIFGAGGGGANPFFNGGGGGCGGHGHRPRSVKGQDLALSLTIPLRQAVLGGERRVDFNRQGRSETLQVRIPPGVESGQRLRVPGKGGESPMGGPAGDLFLEIEVQGDPRFRREGRDLTVRVNVPLSGLCLGCSAEVPTFDGEKRVKVPAGFSCGGRIRLRGFGVPAHGKHGAGDLYAEIMTDVPETLSERQRELLEALQEEGL
ncbi:MAG: integrase [Desulfuromonas sp.]|nr:MAG: integrase [Desulfuromonas sp.]